MFKALLFLVGAILLAHYCDARSVGSADNELEVNDQESLALFGAMQFKHLAMNTINNGRKWLQCAHEEIDTIARKNEKLRELDESIVKYLDKVRKLRRIHDEEKHYEEMGEIFEYILDFSSKYDISDQSNPDTDLKNAVDLLTRNGMDVFDELFVDFVQCADKIVSATEQYINSLSASERRKESKLVRWLHDFKAEQDVEKKFDIFSEFFDLFEE